MGWAWEFSFFLSLAFFHLEHTAKEAAPTKGVCHIQPEGKGWEMGIRGKQPLVLLSSPLLPEEEGPHMHVCVLFRSSLRPMVLSSFKTLAFGVSSLPLAQADRTMGPPISSVFLCLKPSLNPNQTKEHALVSKQQEGVE